MKISPACVWLHAISSPRLLAILIAAYLLVLLVLFPAFAIDTDVLPLDLRFTYDAGIVHALFDALGSAGRRQYLIGAMTLDVLYPIVYSLTFAVWLALLLNPGRRVACVIMLSPFGVLGADLLENASIVVLLNQYPDVSSSLILVASTLTSLKWSIAALVIGALTVLTLRAAINYLRRLI